MTVLSAVQRGALGLATTDSPTFAGLNIDTASGVDGQWDTSGLTVYANGVTPQHDGPLHVMSGSAGTVAAPSYSDELIVESSGQGGITMLSPDASSTNLVFGSPTAQRYAHLQGNYTSGYLEMATFKSGAKFLFSPDNQSQRGEWNTTGLTVHASGVTAQHDGVLHVMSGSAGSITANPAAKTLVVEGDTAAGVGISILSSDQGYLVFGHPTASNFGAWLGYTGVSAGTSTLSFGTNYGASSLIKFYTGAGSQTGEWNTTGLTVFASGVTPQHDGVLHVMSGSAGTVTASVAADELIVEGPGNASGGISILNADANDCNIFFGCPSDNLAAMFQWNYTAKLLAMSTRTAGGYLRFGVEDEGYRGEWTTTGLTCYASGVTPQHDSVLHAMKGTAGTWTSDSGGIIVAESNGAAGIYIGTPDANAGTLGFSSPTKTGASGAIVQFTYDTGIMYYRTFKTGAVMTFRTGNDVEALTLNSSQQMVAATTYSTTVGATNRDLYIDNTGLIGYVSSLQAAKTEIQPITDTSWLHSLNPISFKYRKKNEAGQYTNEIDGDIQYGMIAEEVEAVRPDLCFYDDVADLDANGEKTETTHKELRGIQYSKLVPVLLKEVQKLRTELNQMKAN